jgi:hypothetical protein
MPGDLRDQEQSVPFYYDNKYDRGTNPFEPGVDNLRKYLETVVLEKNVTLSKEKMDDLIGHLKSKGFMCRNPGDESFRNEVLKYIDNIKKAKKVARRWLTLMP